MKNCRRITEIASDAHERPLIMSEKIRLRAHLLLCPGCRAFNNNAKTLSTMLKSFESTHNPNSNNSPSRTKD